MPKRFASPLTAADARARLATLSDPTRAVVLRRFFKTGPGQYGEGDEFLGIPVPLLRKQVPAFQDLSLPETQRLLRSAVHEERLLALLLLVRGFARGDEAAQRTIYDCYLRNTRWINNWDLVDVSAPNIVGVYLLERSRATLDDLAVSKSLWERRIAILATFSFLRRGEFDPTFHIAARLLADREDLIHKAVGWMLREVGKRDQTAEEAFLDEHAPRMPRTMLRYAIERFSPRKRAAYMRRPCG